MGMYDTGGDTYYETKTESHYDPVASKKMAEIAERKQEMSEEQWAIAKEVFEPYEREMVAINRALLPEVAATTSLSMEEMRRDIAMGRDVKDVLRESQLDELRLSRPATEKFYHEAVEGVVVVVAAQLPDDGALLVELRVPLDKGPVEPVGDVSAQDLLDL